MRRLWRQRLAVSLAVIMAAGAMPPSSAALADSSVSVVSKTINEEATETETNVYVPQETTAAQEQTPGVEQTTGENQTTGTESLMANGNWGTCSWTIDNNGVLNISGGVAEQPYDRSTAKSVVPWIEYKDKITQVNFNGKVTFTGSSIWLKKLFAEYSELNSVNGMGNIDTSQVTNIGEMFLNCKKLKDVNLSDFDVSNVNSMQNIFAGCESLTNVNLSTWKISKAKNMRRMFYNCINLKKVDLSGFSIKENYNDVSDMFKNCQLENITTPASLTDAATEEIISGMRSGIWLNSSTGIISTEMLTELDSNTNYILNCELPKGYLYAYSDGMGVAKAQIDMQTSGNYQFKYCSESLSTGEVTEHTDFIRSRTYTYNIDESDNVNLYVIIKDNNGVLVKSNSITIDFRRSGNWGTCEWNVSKDGVLTISSGVAVQYDILAYNNADLPWGNWKDYIEKVCITGDITFDQNDINLTGMFKGYPKLTEINGFNHIDVSKVVNMNVMFNSTSSLKNIDFSGMSFETVTSHDYIFTGCGLKMEDFTTPDNMGTIDFSVCMKYGMWEDEAGTIYPSGCHDLKPATHYIYIGEALSVYGFGRIVGLTSYYYSVSTNQRDDYVYKYYMKDIKTGELIACTDYISQNHYLYNVEKNAEFEVYATVKSLTKGFECKTTTRTVDLSGTDGKWGTCEWKIDDDYTLTITGGTAAQYDIGEYNNFHTPWEKWENCIKNIDITGSITFEEDNVNLSGLFARLNQVREIKGLSYLDTSKAVNMGLMFDGDFNLQSVDVSGFNTSKVTNMAYMFAKTNIKSLDLSSFDMSNVTNAYAFCDETTLNELKMPKKISSDALNSFQTWVKNYMATESWSDMTTDVIYPSVPDSLEAGHSYILTKNRKDMWGTCRWKIEDGVLQIEGGTVSRGIDIPWTDYADEITEVKILGNITFERYASINHAFECKNLVKIEGLEKMDVSNVQSMAYLFAGSKISEIDLSAWDISNVNIVTGMFADCKNLKKLDLSNFNMYSIYRGMYRNNKNDDKRRYAYEDIIAGCANLSEIIVPYGDSPKFDIEYVYQYMISDMADGVWRDVTDGVLYLKKPETLKAGHKYVHCGALSALNVSVGKTEIGDSVELNAVAAGGEGEYLYKFIMYDAKKNQWIKLQDFDENNTYILNMNGIEKAEIYVDVRDDSGKVVRSSVLNIRTTK